MAYQMEEVGGTAYSYRSEQESVLRAISDRVQALRASGSLTPQVLYRLRQYFKIKNIYHSNAIEGNLLNIGETRQVVELRLTITGKPLKDQAEAKNLSVAIDLLESLAATPSQPITEANVREIHSLVLKGICDENAGAYRKVPVTISGSSYEPPSPVQISAEMECFGQWLRGASCPGSRFASSEGTINAAVAHTWLVYIHPFIDGNGRVARLLMNLMLMRYGFPIAVLTREDRLRYYDALEESQWGDLSSFLTLLIESIHESLEEYEAAAAEQREREEWAKSLASRFSEQGLVKAKNEYEVWKSAMELLKGYMRQTVDLINASTSLAHVYFRDFGSLEFEKYLSLRQGESAKKTWFFRVDFRRGDQAARYLFFFGYPQAALRNCHVTLHVAREETPGSYNYERLAMLSADNIPDTIEIGYDSKLESFAALSKTGNVTRDKIEHLGREFFEQVIKYHFSK